MFFSSINPPQNIEHASFQTPPNYKKWCDIIIDFTHINARPQKETY